MSLLRPSLLLFPRIERLYLTSYLLSPLLLLPQSLQPRQSLVLLLFALLLLPALLLLFALLLLLLSGLLLLSLFGLLLLCIPPASKSLRYGVRLCRCCCSSDEGCCCC